MFSNFLADEMRLRRYGIAALTVLLSVGVLFMMVKTINEVKMSDSIGRDTSAANVISVSGQGEAIAIPDTASFDVTVTEKATTVAVAQQAVTKKINAVIAELKKQGLGDGEMKTLNYSLNPTYEYDYGTCTQYGCPPRGNPKIVGYEISQTIEVSVKDLDKAPAILAKVDTLGVSNVSGLSFSVSKQKDFEKEARTKAIIEAKAKAAILAKDLGVSLGRVVSFSENNGYPYPVYYSKGLGGAMAADATPAPQVPAGESKISSQVQIVYEIR